MGVSERTTLVPWHSSAFHIISRGGILADHCILMAYLIPNKYVSSQPRLSSTSTESLGACILGVSMIYSNALALIDRYQPITLMESVSSCLFLWVDGAINKWNVCSFSERGSSWQPSCSCSRCLTAITISRIPGHEPPQPIASILNITHIVIFISSYYDSNKWIASALISCSSTRWDIIISTTNNTIIPPPQWMNTIYFAIYVVLS